MWQVVCITEWKREYVVFEIDDKERAEAKADRLNKVTPPSIKYVVREVEECKQSSES